MEEKKSRSLILGAGMVTTICCFFVFGLMINNVIFQPIAENQVIEISYLDVERETVLVTTDAWDQEGKSSTWASNKPTA